MKRVLLAVMFLTCLSAPAESFSAPTQQSGSPILDESAAFHSLQSASVAKGGVLRGLNLSESDRKQNRELAEDSAAVYRQAMDFLKNFPESPKQGQAMYIGLRELGTAVEAGHKEMRPILEKWVSDAKKNPSFDIGTRIEFAWTLITALNPDRGVGLETGARELLKEFDHHPDAYETVMRLTVLRKEAARAFFEEIAASDKTPPDARASAKGFLKRLSLKDAPFEMSFTALDGREIDTTKLKGKVVLIDFWATWCGPCIGEMPNLKKLYDQFHDRGFEIIGISLDDDRAVLESYLEENQIKWPQHFDGKGWRNKFAVEYGINGIPAMWLLDKNGKVINVTRHQLSRTVEQLIKNN